ncbi:MAG: hypothetical protein GX601_13485 [Anaerolineales bacterium]|nr:hypothetical protein [Anaerolineales bacterium]
MATEPIHLVVLTPSEVLLASSQVKQVHAHLADGGSIGILPRHAPLIAETVAAPLTYVDEQGRHTLELEPGILHIDRSGVTVLTSGRSHPAQAAQSPVEQADS